MSDDPVPIMLTRIATHTENRRDDLAIRELQLLSDRELERLRLILIKIWLEIRALQKGGG